MKPISFSAWSKFMLCPESYNIYYNKRLEPTHTTSALVFGSAVDEALNQLYLKNRDPVETFREIFTYDKMDNVVFHKKDLNMSLFSEEQANEIMPEDDHYKAWACLRVRGRVLLNHYVKTFYPKVKKVIAVQKELSSGRSGFTDLIAQLELENGETILIDHKCSYYPYKKEAANFGAQLVLYAAEEKINKVAYCVMLKDVRTKKQKVCKTCGHSVLGGGAKTCDKVVKKKRCGGQWSFEVGFMPEIQWVVGTPSQHMKDTMTASVNIVQGLITEYDKTGQYPRNYSTCDFVFGQQCPYYDYCHKNDAKNLRERPKR